MYKKQILELREQGLSYSAIQKIIGCSKGTVSRYCSTSKTILQQKELNESEIDKLNQYLISHTYKDAAKHFNISLTSVNKYSTRIGKRIRRKRSKHEINLNASEYKKKIRNELKNEAVRYKGGKCIKCGYNTCNRALEFHHIDPDEKDFNISQANTKYTFDKIKKELDKCVLLCGNCHAELHDGLFEITDYIPAA